MSNFAILSVVGYILIISKLDETHPLKNMIQNGTDMNNSEHNCILNIRISI